MPALEEEKKMDWADQVDEQLVKKPELKAADLPPRRETFDKEAGIRTVIEYKINDDGKKVKMVKTYKVETLRVPKSVAKRKTWRKFGDAASDPAGPNPANTILTQEEINLQWVHTKEAQREAEKETDALSSLKSAQKMVSCRICKGEHWTTKCPYKDTLAPLQSTLKNADGSKEALKGTTIGGRYVPPSLRGADGAARVGESMRRDNRDDTTIRVTNLSEETREEDLQDLFRPFGSVSRIYLAKDRDTGIPKGFAFISFHRREDAARAIAGVSGFGYDHLILKVEWAKPSTDK